MILFRDAFNDFMSVVYGFDWDNELEEFQKKETERAFLTGMLVALGGRDNDTANKIKARLVDIGCLKAPAPSQNAGESS